MKTRLTGDPVEDSAFLPLKNCSLLRWACNIFVYWESVWGLGGGADLCRPGNTTEEMSSGVLLRLTSSYQKTVPESTHKPTPGACTKGCMRLKSVWGQRKIHRREIRSVVKTSPTFFYFCTRMGRQSHWTDWDKGGVLRFVSFPLNNNGSHSQNGSAKNWWKQAIKIISLTDNLCGFLFNVENQILLFFEAHGRVVGRVTKWSKSLR